jgi:hypothetical protein
MGDEVEGDRRTLLILLGAMGMQWFLLSLLLGDFSLVLVDIDGVSCEAGVSQLKRPRHRKYQRVFEVRAVSVASHFREEGVAKLIKI